MDRMVEALVPGMPMAARAKITSQAQGIPLFAVETVRVLIEVTELGGHKDALDGRLRSLHSSLVITPDVEQPGLMGWEALPRVVGLGRRAAYETLESDPGLPSRFGNC